MPTLTQSTKPVSAKDTQRKWHLIDLKGQVLGRVSNSISTLLQGKHKETYAPYLDQGDYVIAINCKQVAVTGKKEKQKVYTYFSGYPSGLKEWTYNELMERRPKEIIRHAVSGKLPKNKLRKRMLTRLYVFENEQHPYEDMVKRGEINPPKAE